MQALVAKENKLRSYYIFSDRAFNTRDPHLAQAIIKKRACCLKTPMRRNNCPKSSISTDQPKVDFYLSMSRSDEEVLQAYDFILLIFNQVWAINNLSENSTKIFKKG